MEAPDVREPKRRGIHKRTARYLEDFSVRIFGRNRIRVATFFFIIISAISITYGLAEIYIIGGLKNEVADAHNEISELKTERDKLNRVNSKLVDGLKSVRHSVKSPILTRPVDGRYVIGRHVTFRWKYDSKTEFPNLILELIRVSKNGLEINRYQVPESGREEMYFEFPGKMKGNFFWRIGPGELINNIYEDELWSRYGRFSLFPTVKEKIIETKELDVGVTATFLSYDHSIDCDGTPNTFDMALISWIATQLALDLKIGTDIKVKRREIVWRDLLRSVEQGNVDLAIASITKSKKRESEHQGLKFTDGYRTNNQAIIYKASLDSDSYKSGVSLSKKQLMKILKGKTVGAQEKSVNLQAAQYLSRSFNYKVRSDFTSYVDVLDKVRTGEIDFGFIDDVRLKAVSYPELNHLNVNLNPLLSGLYKEILNDSESEEYAIAAKDPEFVGILNTLIKKAKKKMKLDELEEKHHYKKRKTVAKRACN